MIFESTWEIGMLMHEYYRVIKCMEEKLGKYTDEWCLAKEETEKLYCQAIELSCKTGTLVMPIDMAIKWVEYKAITDNDGHGYYLHKDGNREDYMCCDTRFLNMVKKDGFSFVEWYNK